MTRASCSVHAKAYLLKSRRKFLKTNVDKSYYTNFSTSKIELVFCKKQQAKNSSWPVQGVGDLWRTWRIPNWFQMCLSYSHVHLASRISLVPFRTFRGPLFPKPVTGQELFLTISYSKLALKPGPCSRLFWLYNFTKNLSK